MPFWKNQKGAEFFFLNYKNKNLYESKNPRRVVMTYSQYIDSSFFFDEDLIKGLSFLKTELDPYVYFVIKRRYGIDFYDEANWLYKKRSFTIFRSYVSI